jgi:hypothetical protein
MSIQSTSNFIFNNVAEQNGANTAYQFTVDYQAANGKPYQFRSQTERIQALIGKQGMSTDYYQPELYCRFYTVTPSVIPSQYGPPNAGWGAEIGRPGGYSVDFQNSFPGTTQIENVGVIAKGYVYSPVPTTLRVQTISDDGIAVYLDGLPIINNWTTHSSTTDTSTQVFLARGYTPIELRYFNSAVDGFCRLFTNIGETGFTQNSGILFNGATSRQS